MRTIKILSIITLLFTSMSIGQNASLIGEITDAESGNGIGSVNIIINNNRYGTSSDNKGNYFFDNIQPGSYEIVFSHIGYKSEKIFIKLEAEEKEVINIKLIPTPINLGEAIVTSTLYEKLIKETPIPIETISKKEINNKNYTNIAEALQNEPGLSIRKDGIWATEATIRGMSQNNIVTIIDGARIETSTNLAAGMSLIDINDIERIEVIKSGASSIYGSGAMGGVVNIISKYQSYSDKFIISGSLSSGFNSVNDGRIGTLTLFANSKAWRIKLNSSYRDAKDTQIPSGRLPNSSFRDNNISASIGLKPFSNQELILNIQSFNALDVGITGGATFPESASAKYLKANRKLYSAEYKINNISERFLSLSAKAFHQKIFRDVEVIPNPNTRLNPGADHKIYGANLNTRFLIKNNNYFVAGFDYWQREYNGYRYRHIIPQNRVIFEKPLPDAMFQSLGIYLHNDLILIPDKLNLMFGGRYDFIIVSNKDVDNPVYIETNGVRNDNPPKNPLASFASTKEENQSWSINVGTLYSVTNDINFTLNISRSFRAPNLEERYQFIELFGFTYLGNPSLKPEEGYFIDFGMQYRSDKFSARINTFFNSLNNLVVDEFNTVDSLFRKTNIGKANLYGFETAFEADIYNNFILYGNISYVRGKDVDLKSDLPQMPPLSSRFGIRTPVIYFASIDFSASVSADQNNVSTDEQKTPGYTLFDISINSKEFNIGSTKTSLHLGVQNIFNKSYRNHLSTYRGILVEEPGRNIFARLNIGW